MNIGYKVSGDSSKFLEPSGEMNIDVVNNMSWTRTPKSGRIEVPTAYVTEYQQSAGQLIASIIYLTKLGLKSVGGMGIPGTGAGPSNAEIYKYKYIAKPTGFSYEFPYFNQQKTSRQTAFSDEQSDKSINPFKSVSDLSSQFMRGSSGNSLMRMANTISTIGAYGTAIKGLVNAAIPGNLNLDLPKEWQGTTEGEYTITFDLFNTGTIEDINNNRNLCYILTHQNTQSRRNAILTDPVCIYDLWIPDVVHFPACSMSTLSITNLGNTRKLDDMTNSSSKSKTKTIPEAYRINMTFKSLLQPSRQILQSEDDGQRVSAVTNETELVEAIRKFNEQASAEVARLAFGPPSPSK